MQNYAINNKLTPFISMQNHYNLVYREEEREMLPMLKHFGVGCIPWSPLARGILTRPISKAKESARAASDLCVLSSFPDFASLTYIISQLGEWLRRSGYRGRRQPVRLALTLTAD